MKLTPEQDNAIRAQARKCISECKAATAGLVFGKDEITRPIINKHYKQIKPICPSHSLFLVVMGWLTGVLKERRYD